MTGKKSVKQDGFIKRYAKRYFIDALSAMALGLFSSLIIGLIIAQIAKIPGLSVLEPIGKMAQSPFVVGSAIGAAVAYGLKVKPLAIFSCIAVGAFAYAAESAGGTGGGPFGAYVAAVVAAECGRLVAGKTKVDIVLVPLVALIPGGLVAHFVSPYIGVAMQSPGVFN